MTDIFVLAWRDTGESRNFIPMSESYQADTEQGAKDKARDLLPLLRGPRYMPNAVLRMAEDEMTGIILSERETFEVASPEGSPLPDQEFVVMG